MGAYEVGGPQWKVGHDFSNPPIAVDTMRSKPLYRNRLENSSFEHGNHLSPWFNVKGKAIPQLGSKNQITPDTMNFRIGGCSMELGPGTEIAQDITGLTPNTWYEFAGFLRAARGEHVFLGVCDYGSQETHSPPYYAHRNTLILPWNRCVVQFKTGPSNTSAKVFIRRTTEGEGQVFADDFGLIFVKSD